MVMTVARIETDPRVHFSNELFAPLDLLYLRGSGLLGHYSQEGAGRGVVVVHGFLAIDASTHYLRQYLTHLGYRVFRSGIGINAGCLNEALTLLLRNCERAFEATGRPIIGIGHSLGGMLIRAAAIRRPDIFSQVITLGSPISEVRVAPEMQIPHGLVAELLASRGCRFGPSCSCAAVAAFRSSFPEAVDHHSIYTKTDGVVSWRCCLEEEGSRNHQVASTHSSLVWNPEALGVVRTLAQATTS